MEKKKLISFFEKYIKEVSDGKGNRNHRNPSIVFVKNAKVGMYDCIDDEAYAEMLDANEIISSFWLDEKVQKGTDILRVMLEECELSQADIRKIAQIMLKCYTPRVKCKDVPDGELDRPDMKESLAFAAIKDTWDKDEDNQSANDVTARRATKAEAGEILQNPRSVYNYLSKHVFGQEAAKRAAATMLCNHMEGNKRNMVFAGPTGCGKTEIWRTLSKVYPNIRVVDASRLTGEGWSGNYKLQDLFSDMDPKEAGKSIFVIDEADKLFEPSYTSNGNNTSFIVQNELLKLMEGDMFEYKPDKTRSITIDTSGISFVFCGSFEKMVQGLDRKHGTKEIKKNAIGFGRALTAETEEKKVPAPSGYDREFGPMDLVQYAGVRQEIAGRIDEIIQLHPMTAEDLFKILEDKYISPIYKLERQYDVQLHVSVELKKALVKDAVESHMGVRFLMSRLRTRLDEILFDDWEATEITLE